MPEPDPAHRGLDRRAFLKTSAGAAAVATPVAAAITLNGGGPAGAARPQAVAAPHAASPAEPVVAYVHDAERGLVTVVAGGGETTYHDPFLTRRLLDAAAPSLNGGGDVVAP